MRRIIVAALTLTALASLSTSAQPVPAPVASSDRKFPIAAGRSSSNETSVLVGQEAGGVALRREVKARLEGDVRFAGLTRIDVNRARGLVRLIGRVTTRADRAAAGELVSSVEGVRLIYNELVVERLPRRRP